MHEQDGDQAVERNGSLAPVIPLFGGAEDEAVVPAEAVSGAEAALVRRLRTRQLSSAEARTMLRERDLEEPVVEAVVSRFARLGYLDDARLAEQLAHAAVTRKGQGRRAVAHALAARGVSRAAIDEALAALPDDDHERAVAFARSKVRRGVVADRDTMLRRLVGQLSRRGYPSSVALSAAREALDETS